MVLITIASCTETEETISENDVFDSPSTLNGYYISKSEFFDADGNLTQTKDYALDKINNSISEMNNYVNPLRADSTTTYQYNEGGQLTSYRRFANGYSSYENTLENGLLKTKKTDNSENGVINRVVTWVYDTNGYALGRTDNRYNDDSLIIEYKNTWGNYKRVAVKISNFHEHGTILISYQYRDNQNIPFKRLEDYGGDGVVNTETEFVIDSNGNITEEITTGYVNGINASRSIMHTYSTTGEEKVYNQMLRRLYFFDI